MRRKIFSFSALETFTLDVLKSTEIEGIILSSDQVRSSIARQLGMDIAGLVPSDWFVEGVVQVTLDATNKLLEGFEGKMNSTKWAVMNKCSADMALRDITDLISKGILCKDEAGGRSTRYMLDEFPPYHSSFSRPT